MLAQVAQVPEVWVSNSPWRLPELSVYSPTAVQLPAEEHDTDSKRVATDGLVPALAGSGALMPVAQRPLVWVSNSPCCLPELSV